MNVAAEIDEILSTCDLGDTRERLQAVLRATSGLQITHERLVDKFATYAKESAKMHETLEICRRALNSAHRLPTPQVVAEQVVYRKELKEQLDQAVRDRDEALLKSRQPWPSHFRSSFDKLFEEKCELEARNLRLTLSHNHNVYAIEDALSLLETCTIEHSAAKLHALIEQVQERLKHYDTVKSDQRTK